jgi:hypothetical protein
MPVQDEGRPLIVATLVVLVVLAFAAYWRVGLR